MSVDRSVLKPLASVEEDGKTVVTTRVAGNFPGSTVNLGVVFGLEGNKIASLEIRV
jgi:hypothetical protein